LESGVAAVFGFDMADVIQRHGYWVVGGVILFESMGIPLPGESLLIAAALYAAATGDIAIEWVVFAAAVGAVLGDNAGYLIGRRVGPPVLERYGPRVGLTVARQRLGQFLFLRHGGKVVFLGRFVAFLRTFAALLAGANRMPWKRFMVWNALGGVVWTSLYGFVPFLLGAQVHRLVGPFGVIVGVTALVAVVCAVVFVHRHEARLIAEAQVAMAAHEAAIEKKQSRHRQVTPARTDM
jgi:membrane protein DedA with SNARE-associated domain